MSGGGIIGILGDILEGYDYCHRQPSGIKLVLWFCYHECRVSPNVTTRLKRATGEVTHVAASCINYLTCSMSDVWLHCLAIFRGWLRVTALWAKKVGTFAIYFADDFGMRRLNAQFSVSLPCVREPKGCFPRSSGIGLYYGPIRHPYRQEAALLAILSYVS